MSSRVISENIIHESVGENVSTCHLTFSGVPHMTVVEPITAYRGDPGVNFSGPHEWSLVRTEKLTPVSDHEKLAASMNRWVKKKAPSGIWMMISIFSQCPKVHNSQVPEKGLSTPPLNSELRYRGRLCPPPKLRTQISGPSVCAPPPKLRSGSLGRSAWIGST